MQATLRYLRSGSSKKRNLGALALLVMLAAGTPALAADTIEELLREDEASSQNDALRVDLNALTEAEWEYYFQVGLKKVDTQLDGKLVERESDWSLRVVYVWVAALAQALASQSAPSKLGPACAAYCEYCWSRFQWRTWAAPLQVMRATKGRGFNPRSSQ